LISNIDIKSNYELASKGREYQEKAATTTTTTTSTTATPTTTQQSAEISSSSTQTASLVPELLTSQTPVYPKSASRPNNAEKLKRGLTNFMNQLNPAPFFVPTLPQSHAQQQQQQQASGSSSGGQQVPSDMKLVQQSSAEPATIVNGEQTVDLIINRGPTRLTYSRPIGGPLRWGRR